MNKKLVCTAVGASLAATAGFAHADFDPEETYAFVPYVVKDASRTTVVTLIGDGQPLSAGAAVHVQYWTKSTTDANTAACQPNSVTVPMTDGDIMTFDTAGLLGYPLFGDTTNPAPLGLSISYAAPRHGYLVAEMLDGDGFNGVYWLELDIANGGAHGNHGLMSSALDWRNYFENPFVMDNDTDGNLSYATAVAFWPSSVATTVFTVTPLGTDMVNRENNQAVLQVFNGASTPVQGAYDRNENGVDGTVPQTVRCVGRLTPANLMPGVVANAAWAAQGGWGYLANLGDNNTPNGNNATQGGTNSGDLDIVVYQIDTSSAGGKFMSNATTIRTDWN